jgi:hypothetical protein
MKDLILGCIPSTMDGSEKIFGVSEEITLPESYSYVDVLPSVLNQGQDQICVPCTISSYLNWKKNLEDGTSKDNDISLFEIYRSRTNYGEGMTYKDALKYLRKNGVKSDAGRLYISQYGRVMSELMLKYAIIMNGPCFGALPVYSDRDCFWRKGYGDNLQGYHAIALVGYNKEGFVIRNSWGKSFGDDGYVTIPYNEFNELIEIWTIMS